jgi:hypothetical protein
VNPFKTAGHAQIPTPNELGKSIILRWTCCSLQYVRFTYPTLSFTLTVRGRVVCFRARPIWPCASAYAIQISYLRSQISDRLGPLPSLGSRLRVASSGRPGAHSGGPHTGQVRVPMFPLPLTDGEGAPAGFATLGSCVSAVNDVERPAQRVAHMFDGPFKPAWNGPSLWVKRTRGQTAANKGQV